MAHLFIPLLREFGSVVEPSLMPALLSARFGN
jgi:hypothetical protein